MLTRDSWVWIIGFVGALATYLATVGTPPTAWTYGEWLKLVLFIVAYIVGRLGASPLAGANTAPKDTRPALLGLVRLTEK